MLASQLDSHSVLLECFHPSAKLTEPPYFCTYRGTNGLQLYDGFAEDDKDLAARLGQMRNMYSRFRPHRRELETGGRRVRGPPGDIPGSRTYPGTAQDPFEGESVRQILSLDGDDLFTQLVSQMNLVKLGPRNGLFTCFVEIEEGVIRVRRDWLRNMAAAENGVGKDAMHEEPVEVVGKGKEAVYEEVVSEEKSDGEDEAVLWVSTNKHTGIRFKVKERKLRRDVPILIKADEGDMPVSYEIEYDGTYCIILCPDDECELILYRNPHTDFPPPPHA